MAGDARLRELLSQDGLTDDAEHAEALALLRAHPAMDAARADLRRWSDIARIEIAGLPSAEMNKYFNEGQMEVRASTLRTAYKLARQLVIEVAK